jgi:hypothetical protein
MNGDLPKKPAGMLGWMLEMLGAILEKKYVRGQFISIQEDTL